MLVFLAGVALVSVAESLDTSWAAGRLVLNIMTAVRQWERAAIGASIRPSTSGSRGSVLFDPTSTSRA
jgi:DNA invertase Pin-like site-specific DNA recombinase